MAQPYPGGEIARAGNPATNPELPYYATANARLKRKVVATSCGLGVHLCDPAQWAQYIGICGNWLGRGEEVLGGSPLIAVSRETKRRAAYLRIFESVWPCNKIKL